MFPLARFRVEERSMSPDLEPGDYVIVNRWAYRAREPSVGDQVVLRDPEREGRYLCKRIHAVEGPDRYVVRGDDEAASRDSRRFGPVSRDRIVGKVLWTIRASRERRTD